MLVKLFLLQIGKKADNYGFGAIGSNLTNSSGTFSFPSTGIYLISASSPMYSQWTDSASTDNWGIFMSILVTTDNSNYNMSIILLQHL